MAGVVTALAAPIITGLAAAAGAAFGGTITTCCLSAIGFAGIGILTNGIQNLVTKINFLLNFNNIIT